jgi:sarcosine oxidase subunit delta
VRIACPFCGERGNEEFAYLGDATVVRPDPGAAGATQAFADYLYLRNNVRGLHRELWYHAAGCHGWLVVTRDTMSHEIKRVEFARDMARARPLAAGGGR